MVEVGARVGSYVVEAFLGEGGSAQVWRVEHVELGVSRALKVPKRGVGEGDRSAREARLQAEIAHPNVVRVHDVLGVGGQPALVMELSQGGSLWDALRQGAFDEGRALRVGRDLARGLEEIHARGVVHRDVKPSNVLLMGDEGRAALTDFGVAREEGSEHTKTGEVLGTPYYMAPEQLRSTADVGPAADMYAFGVVLYELFVGERPTQSTSQVAGRLAGRPKQVVALVTGCLDPEPESRPDAARAREILEQASRGRRSVRALALGVCALVGLCALVVWGVTRGGAPEDAPAPTPVVVGEAPRPEPLRRAFEKVGTDPGEVAALWRAANVDGPAALERALWDEGGEVRVVPTEAEVIDVFTTPTASRIVGLTTMGWIHVWDRETGERIFAMDSAAGVPSSAHLSADGSLVAVVPHSARSTSGSRSQVRVLDLNTGKVRFTASNGDTSGATFFAFGPDATRALTYSHSYTMTVWDVGSGAQVARLDLHASNCSGGAAFGPDGRIATLAIDGVLRIYDEEIERVVESKIMRKAGECVLRWTEAHGLVASAGGEVVRVDAATGEVVARASGVGGAFEVGTDVIVAYDRQRVTILDAETLAVRRELAVPKGILDVAMDGAQEQIATAGLDGVVRVWSMRTGRLLHALEGHRSWVHSLTGASGGGWELWSAGRDRTLRAWRLPEPEGAMFDVEVERLYTGAMGRLVFGWGGGGVRVHSWDDGAVVFEAGLSSEGVEPDAIDASPDGARVLVRHGNHAELHEIAGPAAGTKSARISSGFVQWVVGADPVRMIVSNTGMLRRLEVGEDGGTSEVRWEIERNPSHVGQTEDGQWLFMTSFDRTLTVWPVGKEAEGSRVYEMGCAQPSFIAPVGLRSVVLGDWGGCMELWDVSTGERKERWEGHQDAITRIEQVSGGWVSSSLDGTVRWWGEGGGRRALGRHDGGVFGFAVSQDRVVSMGADGAIRSWSLDGQDAGPVAYVPSRPKGVWGSGGKVRVVDEDGLIWSHGDAQVAPWSNLRVCPETLDVVPVVPFPRGGGSWAPERECEGSE